MVCDVGILFTTRAIQAKWIVRSRRRAVPQARLLPAYPERRPLGHDRHQLVSIYRLGQVVVATGLDALLSIAAHGLRRQGDDRTGISLVTQSPGSFVSVEHRHLHVHQHDVEWLLRVTVPASPAGMRCQGILDRLLPVSYDCHFGAGTRRIDAISRWLSGMSSANRTRH